MLMAWILVATTITAAPLVMLLRTLLPMLRVTAALRLWRTGLLMQRVAGLEARDDAQFDLAAHELFDIRHQRTIVEGD